MQDDEARDNHDALERLRPGFEATYDFDLATVRAVTEQRDFALGQVAYWKKKYEQTRDALESGEAPPNTINVAMGDLSMEYLLYQDQTGTWRIGDKREYAEHDGHKRAIITLESK